MKIKCFAFLLITILFSGLSASAQTWLWGNEGSSGLKADVFASNVATNKTGNVYQAGSFVTSISFGSTTLTSLAQEDVYLVKYDQNGNLLWVKQSEGGVNSFALNYSVASDDSDNAYVTGFVNSVTSGGLDTLSFGSTKLYFSGLGQFFVVKYNASGNLIWVKQSDTTSLYYGTEAWAITTDKFKHEYVTGDGAYLFKYDINGNMIWSVPQINSLYGVTSDIGYSVATDASGDVYMAGVFSDSLQFGATTLYNIDGGIFIAKFDSNGNALWAQQSDGFYLDNYGYGVSVAVDKAGAAYLTAALNSDSIYFGSYGFPSYINSGFFVVKFNPGGSIAWAETANPSASTYCSSNSIAADDSNHIYITGNTWDGNLVNASFTLANYTVSVIDTSGSDNPSFIVKLDTAGKVICGSTLQSGGTEPNAVATDSSGRYVYMGGMFLQSFAMGVTNLIDNTGGYDTYVGRWQACDVCNLAINMTTSTQTICAGDSAHLKASGANSYKWISSTDGIISTEDSVVINPTITTTYNVVGTSGSCTDSSQMVIMVIAAPNVPTITVKGDTLISSAKTNNQWYINDILIPGATDSFYITKNIKGLYTVKVTNPADGCTSVSQSTTGINQLSIISEQLSVYPNPFTNELIIKINTSATDIKDWNLRLTDMLGRSLYSMPSINYNNEIDLSGLATGMYFITIENNTGRMALPVVKQ